MFVFLPLGDDHNRLILFKKTPAKAALPYAFVLALLVDWQLGWRQNATEVENNGQRQSGRTFCLAGKGALAVFSNDKYSLSGKSCFLE
ncbi:MAG: hypothetical protein E3J21_11915 [Anaerolineales bacterium]|nr:MAG: hypothetical protein E3J21_11915 [Anaerolineales bacterium]